MPQPSSVDWRAMSTTSEALFPIWVFPRIGGKPPKWMIFFMENPIEMDDLGIRLSLGISHGNTSVSNLMIQRIMLLRKSENVKSQNFGLFQVPQLCRLPGMLHSCMS